ncbi:GspE/PulE family protein [Vibrio vulnificus]
MSDNKLKSINVVIDDTLLAYYREDKANLLFDNGELWTTNFEASRLRSIISYVESSTDLLGGRFFKRPPYVMKVDESVLNAYRNEIDKYEESSDLDEAVDDFDADEDESSSVKERLWYVLQEAVNRGSSDVHIEVHKACTRLFSRVDGKRVPIGQEIPNSNYGLDLFSVIFLDLAKDKLADFVSGIANAGRVEHPLRVNGVKRNTIWRASYMPAKDGGGKLSLRWLNKTEKIPQLNSLGYTVGQMEQLEKFIRRSKGVFLLSGVTNSGKSTLIASLVQRSKELYPGRSHHTLEDPPEFDLGVIQTHVQPNQRVDEKTEEYKDYNYYIKVLLRQDPDFISIGEIRDHEVAMGACRMGDAGQLVMATMHTSSAIGIGETLISQYKVDPAILATPDLMCIWATQTLVRTTCNRCKIPHSEVEAIYKAEGVTGEYIRGMRVLEHNIENMADYDSIFWRNPKGCKHCNSGEKGLTACLEMIVFDEEDRHFLVNEDYLGWHKALREKGYKELKDHAMLKIKSGLLDVNTAFDRVPTLYEQEAKSVYEEMFS